MSSGGDNDEYGFDFFVSEDFIEGRCRSRRRVLFEERSQASQSMGRVTALQCLPDCGKEEGKKG